MKHTSNLKKERIALAYQILGGIPEEVIFLNAFRKAKGKSLDCGTICCGAGWLALHPDFNAMGLTANKYGEPMTASAKWGFHAIDEIFGEGTYKKVFTMRHTGDWDDELLEEIGHDASDKALLMARLKKAYDEASA